MKKPGLFRRLQVAFERFQNAQNINSLEQVGKDSNGAVYYSWKDLGEIPRERHLRIEGFTMFDEVKLSESSLDQILHAIDEINMKLPTEKNQDKKVRYHAQIAHLTGEIRFRMQGITPIEVLLNIAAALCVRHDEKPEEFSQVIHAQKVDLFKEELKKGNSFFFNSPTWIRLMPTLIMSTENWTEYMNKSILLAVREDQRLQTILSKNESKNTSEAKKN